MFQPMRSTITNRKILIRSETNGNKILPNTWKPLQSDQCNSVLFGCDRCEWMHVISINHKISDDGIVMPSVGSTECGYHEWVKLQNWSD